MKKLIGFKIDEETKKELEEQAKKHNKTLSDFIRDLVLKENVATEKELQELKEKIEELETNVEIFLQDLKSEIYKSFSDFAEELAKSIVKNLSNNNNRYTTTNTTTTTTNERKNIKPTWAELKTNPALLKSGDTVIIVKNGEKIETELIKSTVTDLQLKNKLTKEKIVFTYFMSKDKYDKEILGIYRNF